jgi:hypothetical protein
MGVAPTGRQMTDMAVAIHRIVGGKIAEEWSLGTVVSRMRGRRLEQERIERERIEQELRVARSIRQASLPKEVPEHEGWQISPFYQPAREVGGDFYDFHEALILSPTRSAPLGHHRPTRCESRSQSVLYFGTCIEAQKCLRFSADANF